MCYEWKFFTFIKELMFYVKINSNNEGVAAEKPSTRRIL